MNDLSTALGRAKNALASNLGADGVLVLAKGDVAELLALIDTRAPLDYGSLDPAQRLAVCRGEQPVAVVLPDREMYCQYLRGVIPNNRLEVEAHKDGWNACLDELKRLNLSL